MTRSPRRMLLSIAVAAFAAFAAEARADMIVLNSDSAKYKAGQTLKDNEPPAGIEPGRSVRVLVTPQNVTRDFHGPVPQSQRSQGNTRGDLPEK